jgi:hypothetical protein
MSIKLLYKERFEDFWEKVKAEKNEEKIIQKNVTRVFPGMLHNYIGQDGLGVYHYTMTSSIEV